MIDETLAILSRLVSFDTTSRESNLELVHWVADHLDLHGVPVELLPSPDGRKATLVARLGPGEPGGVVLCGHTDVVPVDGQPWTVEPFALTESDGRLSGRGTTDMKGFIAAVLAAAPRFAERGLTRPITIALTYDEEVGALAAPQLAAHLKANDAQPRCVIVGEPTSMRAVTAHKGIRVLRTDVTGRAAHSSQPGRGSSAVTAAAEVIVRLDHIAQELATRGARSEAFEPPYTTVNVGTVMGGQALNIVPGAASVLWEYRHVPGEDVAAILQAVNRYCEEVVVPRLRRTAPEAGIVTRVIADIPALAPTGTSDPTALLAQLGVEREERGVAYGTEASILQEAGLPTIVCGPGSMEQGHQPDEYIERAELVRCGDFLTRLGEWARTPRLSCGSSRPGAAGRVPGRG